MPGSTFRHRDTNTGRKAGNISEWVSRFGGRYAQFIILDADSLMTGDTIVRLVGALEGHPGVGLIQTLPVIVNGKTLFARMQQFAGRMYGPVIARGISCWHGSESNYWGHNALFGRKHLPNKRDCRSCPAGNPLAATS
jgi:membrane glycosyltransferase